MPLRAENPKNTLSPNGLTAEKNIVNAGWPNTKITACYVNKPPPGFFEVMNHLSIRGSLGNMLAFKGLTEPHMYLESFRK